MNKNYFFALACLIMMFTIFFSYVFLPKSYLQVNADIVPEKNDYEVTALSMALIEQTSGRVLMQKDMDKQLPMASTTKIMTALVALNSCDDLDSSFAVDNRAVGIEGSSIYLKKNEKLSMRELLYGMMLPSGNDAAMAIAYKVGDGDLNKFVQMMNDEAKTLNLHNTHFDNPHGLDSETHYTSAYDLAIISAKAMENQNFRDIVKTTKKQISSSDGENRFLRNKHKLVGSYDGCDGIKIGFTDNARRCCVTSAKRDNMRLICVVLNCNNMFEESAKLLDMAFDKYKMTELLSPYKFLTSIKVENGNQESVKVFTEKGFSYPLTQNEADFVSYKELLPNLIEAPLQKHQEIGDYEIYLDNDLIFTEKIYTIEDVNEAGISTKVKDILERWYYD